MGSIVCYECEKDRKVYCSECSATLHQLKRRQTHRLVPFEEDFNECLFGPEQPHPELDTEESNIEEFDVQLNKVGKTLGIRIHQPAARHEASQPTLGFQRLRRLRRERHP